MSLPLQNLRVCLDGVDRELVRLLLSRLELVRAVADVKRAEGRPALDAGRESAILARVRALAPKADADAQAFLQAVMGCVVEQGRLEVDRLLSPDLDKRG